MASCMELRLAELLSNVSVHIIEFQAGLLVCSELVASSLAPAPGHDCWLSQPCSRHEFTLNDSRSMYKHARSPDCSIQDCSSICWALESAGSFQKEQNDNMADTSRMTTWQIQSRALRLGNLSVLFMFCSKAKQR